MPRRKNTLSDEVQAQVRAAFAQLREQIETLKRAGIRGSLEEAERLRAELDPWLKVVDDHHPVKLIDLWLAMDRRLDVIESDLRFEREQDAQERRLGVR